MKVIIRLSENEIERLKHGGEIMIPVKNNITACNVEAIVVKKGRKE